MLAARPQQDKVASITNAPPTEMLLEKLLNRSRGEGDALCCDLGLLFQLTDDDVRGDLKVAHDVGHGPAGELVEDED